MPSMKCVSCGIGFFSATGSEKCGKCQSKEPQEAHQEAHQESHQEGHDSCGCGHSH